MALQQPPLESINPTEQFADICEGIWSDRQIVETAKNMPRGEFPDEAYVAFQALDSAYSRADRWLSGMAGRRVTVSACKEDDLPIEIATKVNFNSGQPVGETMAIASATGLFAHELSVSRHRPLDLLVLRPITTNRLESFLARNQRLVVRLHEDFAQRVNVEFL